MDAAVQGQSSCLLIRKGGFNVEQLENRTMWLKKNGVFYYLN